MTSAIISSSLRTKKQSIGVFSFYLVLNMVIGHIQIYSSEDQQIILQLEKVSSCPAYGDPSLLEQDPNDSLHETLSTPDTDVAPNRSSRQNYQNETYDTLFQNHSDDKYRNIKNANNSTTTRSSNDNHDHNYYGSSSCSSDRVSRWQKIVSRTPQSGNFLLVNTIDGKIHGFFLDCNNSLKYKWTFALDDEQFKHNLNSLNFGDYFLIPSLSGNLYSFDGNSLFHVHLPIKGDSNNPDVSFSGGTITNLYGLDFLSGEVIYKCVNGNCSTALNSKHSNETVVIRQDKFTHSYVNSITGKSHIQVNVSEIDINTFLSNSATMVSELLPLDSLRVHISDGILNQVDENNYLTFQQFFNAPIVNMWQISSNAIKTVQLFTSPINPSIDKSLSNKSHFKYIGYFKKSLYIIESMSGKRQQSRDIIFDKDYHTPFYEFLKDIKIYHDNCGSECDLPGRSQKSGFYIGFNNEKSRSTIQYPQIGHELQIPMKNNKKDTLLSFWKEILLICAVTSVVFHISLCRLKGRRLPGSISMSDSHISQECLLQGNSTPRSKFNDSLQIENSSHLLSFENGNPNELNGSKNVEYDEKLFTSRFFNDFTYISMIGRGGFGHVHKCQHVIDGKIYAIKQINLPYRKISQDKIFREVHALANLEHPNILRYYHSWVENPPKHWYIAKTREVFTEGTCESFQTEDIEALFNPSFKLMQSCTNDSENHDDIMNSDKKEDYIQFISSTDNSNKSDEQKFVKNSPLNGNTNPTNIEDQFKEFRILKNLKNNQESDPNRFIILYIQVEMCINKSLDYWLMIDPEELYKKYPHNPLKNREKRHLLEVFLQLANAIKYVHEKGLMHRDLKPANIFFNKDNVLKLGDFGLVAFKLGAPSNLSKDAIQKLASNVTVSSDVGTLLYMSPEILSNKCYSQKVDIYSMAMILFELLETINTQSEKIEKLYKLKMVQFPPNFQKQHPKICHMIKCMMVSNPKKRWNAVKVVDSLNQYLKESY